jgi:hypothetical protein
MNLRNLTGHRYFSFRRTSSSMGILLLLLIAVERPAHAYTDPGSGAMMYQVLAAACLGAGFYARRVFRWFTTRGRG